MIYLDTSVLIRFFTKDDEQKAKQTKKILEKEDSLGIADVVFPEIEYVLLSLYDSNREDVAKAFRFLLAQKNIKLSRQIERAVYFYEQSNLDMADCIIASQSLGERLFSYDEGLLKTEGVEEYEY